MKYAHIEEKTNKILGWYDTTIHKNIPTPNVEVSEEEWKIAISINANIYTENGFIFKDLRTDEEIYKESIPQVISLRQAREILIKRGLFEQVHSYIESIEDPTQKAIIINYWEYSTVFERRNPTVLQMSEMLGLSSEQLDELFIEASKL